MAGETTISRTYNMFETATDPSKMPGLFDSITTHIPTIYYLMEQKSVEQRGGDRIRFRPFKELVSITGAGPTQDVTPIYIQPWTVGEYGFKFLYGAVKIPNQSIILNQGQSQNFDLAQETMAVMVKSLIQEIGSSTRGIWTSGVTDEGDLTKITGIPSLIRSTANGNATATTGGIARTNSWWQNQVGTAITSFATNGKAGYQSAILLALRGSDFPDLGVTNRTQFGNYLTLFSTTMHLNNPISGDRFDVGVPNVDLFGIRMYPDAQAPANEARFINTEYLKLVLLENDYLAFAPPMAALNQDDTIVRLRFTGNLFAPVLTVHAIDSGGDTA